MTTSAEDRTLLLLRHGEAVADPMMRDRDRPLTDRGRAQARAVGTWLREHGLGCDLVLCSTTLRTRQTCEAIAAAGECEAEVRHDDRIPGADAHGLLDVIRDADESAQVVLVIGHNPTLPSTVSMLADGAGAEDAHETLTRGCPPATLAVLEYRGPWSVLGFGEAELTRVVRADDLL